QNILHSQIATIDVNKIENLINIFYLLDNKDKAIELKKFFILCTIKDNNLKNYCCNFQLKFLRK
ncbi:hypothetical protein, partial [Enterococcus faecium]|uniref:hypothetical protein n=1 Tax=Enterococcus faecium TaxID=1352 RepID=UPI0031CD18F5